MRLTVRGWAALYVAVALLLTAFLVWADAVWLTDYPTTEQEASWLR